VIKTFRCNETEQLSLGHRSKRFGNIEAVARRKLRMIQTAAKLNDLKAPPGNRIKTLIGDRKGQHSIRINEQWRVCFEWRDGDAYSVEIVDYH
jgi:proteic killer suppression protein